MHHMDADKAYSEKPRQELHKNATSYIEQILKTTVSISKTIQIRQTRHVGHCWRSEHKLISDILLWTPSHGHCSVGRPTRTYFQQLCADIQCSLENLPKAMDDRD